MKRTVCMIVELVAVASLPLLAGCRKDESKDTGTLRFPNETGRWTNEDGSVHVRYVWGSEVIPPVVFDDQKWILRRGSEEIICDVSVSAEVYRAYADEVNVGAKSWFEKPQSVR